MRRFLLPLFLLLSPFLTFVVVTTFGKEFTNGRAPATEIGFQYLEALVPWIESFGVDLSSAHAKLNDNYGWCTKYKPIVQKVAPPAPKPVPVAAPIAPIATSTAGSAPAPGAAPVVAAAQPSSTVVAVAPVAPPPPPKFSPPTNANNIPYAYPTDLSGGFEAYCNDPEGGAFSVLNTSPTGSSIEFQRFLKKPLLISPDSSRLEIVAREKYGFYLRTKIGDLFIQGVSAANIAIFTDQLRLNIVAKSGAVLISNYRGNSDLRTVVPIKLAANPGASIRFEADLELKNGQSIEISNEGPVRNK